MVIFIGIGIGLSKTPSLGGRGVVPAGTLCLDPTGPFLVLAVTGPYLTLG